MAVTRDGDDPPAVIESFVAGDEVALAEIYARWSSLVYSVALRSLGQVADADEVTQRVFTKAWALRHTFVATRTNLPGWLIEITRSDIADAHAARSKQAQLGTQGTTLTRRRAEIDSSDLAARLVLADEMSRLAAIPQQVVRMALADGLTHVEIADRLGLPAGVVKSHLGRSLVTMRERLAEVRGAH